MQTYILLHHTTCNFDWFLVRQEWISQTRFHPPAVRIPPMKNLPETCSNVKLISITFSWSGSKDTTFVNKDIVGFRLQSITRSNVSSPDNTKPLAMIPIRKTPINSRNLQRASSFALLHERGTKSIKNNVMGSIKIDVKEFGSVYSPFDA